MSSSRSFEFTHNNYTQEDIDRILKWDCKYVVIGKEIAPTTGTPHLQGYVEFKNSVLWKTVTNKKNKNYGFIDKWCKPSEQRCPITYCKKDGDFLEKGEPKHQGERNDLKVYRDSIMSGESVDNILLDNPYIYHTYGRTLSKIEDLRLRRQYRTEMTKGIWYWGPTGVGKSHKAYENFHPDTHYVYPNDNGWWDGYTQQHTVIFNEFRGQITYSELLDLVDKWPKTVKRRNREPMPFTSKVCIITSSLHPKDVYHNLAQNDKLEQLLRRFDIIEIGGRSSQGGNTRPLDVTSDTEEMEQYLMEQNLV